MISVVLWLAVGLVSGGLCLVGLSLLGALDERVSAPGGVLVRRPRDNEEAALDYMKTEYVEGRVDLELLETALEFVFERPEEVSGVYAFALARQKLGGSGERALLPRDEEWEAEAAARARVTNFHQVFDPPTLPATARARMAAAMVEPFRSGPTVGPVVIGERVIGSSVMSSVGTSMSRLSDRVRLRRLGVVFPEDK